MADIFDIEFYCISVILYTIFQVLIRFSVCRDVVFCENKLKLLFHENPCFHSFKGHYKQFFSTQLMLTLHLKLHHSRSPLRFYVTEVASVDVSTVSAKVIL